LACYLIGCDLNGVGRDYIALVEAIEKVGSESVQCLDSTWIVVTGKSAVEIRDELKSYMDRNDELFVAQLAGDAAWRGRGRNVTDGLGKVFRPSHPG
jgi:hypothetical protein